MIAPVEPLLLLFKVALTSAVVSVLLVLKAKLGVRIGMDPAQGVQKLHRFPVPRTGGVAAFAAILLGGWLYDFPRELMLVFLAALPAWLWGLSEDLTGQRSALSRLLATMASGLLLVFVAGLGISRLDLPSDAFVHPVLWLLFTSFAISGLSNAVNIIDGVNGLASFTAASMFACLALLADRCGDPASLQLALLGLGSSFGFFLVNWPRGQLFLGDGGAYLLGFWLGATAISLVQRNGELTAWFALALFAYPVSETLFSWYRRRVHHKVSPTAPDRLHLHSLVYMRRARWGRLRLLGFLNPNSATLVRMLPIVLAPPIGAYFAAESMAMSLGVVVLTVALYLRWFKRLVRFDGGQKAEGPKPVPQSSWASGPEKFTEAVSGDPVSRP